MNLNYNLFRSFACFIFFICIFSQCAIAQSTMTAVPGSCSGSTNQYGLSGIVSLSPVPASGQMIVSVAGEGTFIKNAPFSSSINYSIAGLNSDGGSKTVSVTFTESATTINQNYTAPAACIVNTCTGASGSETFSYNVPLQLTDLDNAPVTLPLFNTMSGTRTLQKVLIAVQNTILSNAIAENNAVTVTTAGINATVSASLNLESTEILNSSLATKWPSTSFAAGISIPASGSYSGDLSGSTLRGLTAYSPNWQDALSNFTDPRTSPNWITTLTGNAGDDADIKYFPAYNISKSNSTLITSSLTDYMGTGNLPLTVSTLSGYSLSGGGGNLYTNLTTKFGATTTITYFYCTSSGGPLPLTLISFEGNTENDYNILKWSTNQVYNANKFIIERSTDGINYTTAGEVSVINTNLQQEYTYKDYASNNKWFYRLKILDNNGSYKYSSIVSLKERKTGSGFSVYPNPATDKIFINSAKKIDKLEIINATGSVVNKRTNINLTDPVFVSSLAPGIYYAKAYTANEVFISKFIKK